MPLIQAILKPEKVTAQELAYLRTKCIQFASPESPSEIDIAEFILDGLVTDGVLSTSAQIDQKKQMAQEIITLISEFLPSVPPRQRTSAELVHLIGSRYLDYAI